MIVGLAALLLCLSPAGAIPTVKRQPAHRSRSPGHLVTIPLVHAKRPLAGRRNDGEGAEGASPRFAQWKSSGGSQAIPLANQESFYSGSIELGTPAQTFHVVFDTGSDYLLVPSVYCQTQFCESAGGKFNPADSSSYISQTPANLRSSYQFRSLKVTFGSGTVRAVLGEETLKLGDLTIPKVLFGQIIEDDLRLGNTVDLGGILGMSSKVQVENKVPFTSGLEAEDTDSFLQSSSSSHTTTTTSSASYAHASVSLWHQSATDAARIEASVSAKHAVTTSKDKLEPATFDASALSFTTSCVRSKVLSSNIFSFFFSNNPDIPGGLTLGGFDPSHADGEPVLLDVTTEGIYWQVDLEDVKVGGKSLNLCGPGKPCTAIIDTGTTMILSPDSWDGPINKALGINFDCSNIEHLPTVAFRMGGHDFELTPEDYLTVDLQEKAVNGKSTKVAGCDSTLEGQASMGAEFYATRSYGELFNRNRGGQASDLGLERGAGLEDSEGMSGGLGALDNAVVLGGHFLKHFLSVFDVEKRQIGLVRAVHSSSDRPDDVKDVVRELNEELRKGTFA